MISLANFPPEILCLIVDGASSFIVIPLLQCGDATLSRKLYSSVTTIDLEDTRTKTTSRFPNCVSSFPNLRHLTINRGNHPLVLPANVSKLHLAKLETLSVLSSQSNDLWSLCVEMALFPCLTTLSLTSDSGKNGYLEEIQCLPPTLTDLSMPKVYVYDETLAMPVFGALPRGLLAWRSRLVLFCEIAAGTVPPFFQDPPPAIHTLHISGDSCENHYSYAFLPRTVTDIHFHHTEDAVPCLSGPAIISLPPGLKHTHVYIDDSELRDQGVDTFAEWPPIDRFTVYSSHLQTPIRLPGSITSLAIKGAPFDLCASSRTWPVALSTFLFDSTVITLPDLKLLPRTIIRLEVQWDTACFPGEVLNPALTDLAIHLTAVFESFSISSKLPPSLTSLTVDMRDPPSEPKLIDFQLNGDSLLHLRMDRFKFSKSSSSEAVAPKLPPKLQTFHAGCWVLRHFGQLPRSLTDLSIYELPTSINAMIPMETDVFEDLPLSLTKLRIRAPMSNIETFFSRCSFQSLENLVELYMFDIGGFEYRILENNWPKLRTIELYINDSTAAQVNPNWTRAQILTYYQGTFCKIPEEEDDMDW